MNKNINSVNIIIFLLIIIVSLFIFSYYSNKNHNTNNNNNISENQSSCFVSNNKSCDNVSVEDIYTKLDNSVSYFYCNINKSNVILNCENNWSKELNKGDCQRIISTGYTMYLLKNNSNIKEYDNIKKLMGEWIDINNQNNFSKEELSYQIDKFVSNNNTPFPYSDEFNLMKNINEKKILNSTKDKDRLRYFQNIIKFRDSKNISDCSNIIFNTSVNYYDYILKDSCELYFSKDKRKYCNSFLLNKIK